MEGHELSDGHGPVQPPSLNNVSNTNDDDVAISTCRIGLYTDNFGLDAELTRRLVGAVVDQYLFFSNQVPFPVARLDKVAAPNEKIRRKRTEFITSRNLLLSNFENAIPRLQSSSQTPSNFRLVIALGNPTLPSCSSVLLFECPILHQQKEMQVIREAESPAFVTGVGEDMENERPPISPLPSESDSDSDIDDKDPHSISLLPDNGRAIASSLIDSAAPIQAPLITQNAPHQSIITPPLSYIPLVETGITLNSVDGVSTIGASSRLGFTPFRDPDSETTPSQSDSRTPKKKKGLAPHSTPATNGTSSVEHEPSREAEFDIKLNSVNSDSEVEEDITHSINGIQGDRVVNTGVEWQLKEIERDIVVQMGGLEMFADELGLSKIHVYLHLPGQSGEESEVLAGWHPRSQVTKTLDSLFEYPNVDRGMRKKVERLRGKVCKVLLESETVSSRPMVDKVTNGRETLDTESELEDGIWLEWEGKLAGVE